MLDYGFWIVNDVPRMKENLIIELTYRFALDVMAAAKVMRERREFDPASQLWRSGTSVGANVEEAQAAQSRADFRSKMGIAPKEARETHYWLRLACDGGCSARRSRRPFSKGSRASEKS